MSGPFVDNSGRGWKWWSYHLKSTFAVLLSIAILVGAGVLVYQGANKAYVSVKSADDYIGEGKDPVTVVIPKGATGNDIGYQLIDQGVIKSMKAYKKAVAALPTGQQIQAGKYQLKTEMPAAAAVAMLADPKNRVVTRVTIPEGMTMKEFFPLITKGSGIKDADLMALAAKPAPLGLPAYSGGKAEGFLFPDTYEVDDDPTATEFLTQMSGRYKTVANELNFEERAASQKLTPLQALIVASIAEKEVNNEEDMKLVAGVIQNRLAKGMKLELDSTVIYGLGIKGRLTTTDAERAKPTPYNTYVIKGLPVGPISNPGKLAMAAAVNPTPSEYLFWVVTDPSTGETAFAKTNEEHEENKKKFHAWCSANPGKC